MQVRRHPEDVGNRLFQLGLTEEVLIRAVSRGHLERAECTPNHPSMFPGLVAWGWTVAALRDSLVPAGWSRSEEGNWPVTISPNRRMAIAVATGDENTGNPDAVPMTKSSKGPNTAQAVAVNMMQASLFDDLVLPDQVGDDEKEERLTWLLLVSTQGTRVRSELSLPVTCNGKVDGWKERIILRDVDTDPTAGANPAPILPDLPDIDIPLQRRQT
jgi:hypothetical protein